MALLKQWSIGLVVFVLLDAAWLGAVANGFYQRELGPLLRRHANGDLDPRLVPAALLYALIILGLALFALPRARGGSSGEAALWSAVFGVIAYSVYDLTNYSTMRGFPLGVAAIDMVWGGVVCAAAGAAMHAARTWASNEAPPQTGEDEREIGARIHHTETRKLGSTESPLF